MEKPSPLGPLDSKSSVEETKTLPVVEKSSPLGSLDSNSSVEELKTLSEAEKPSPLGSLDSKSSVEQPKTPSQSKKPSPLGFLGSKSSVEEPKTLSQAELKELREKALEIINNHSSEEATKIFLAGLKLSDSPVAEAQETSKKTVCGKRSRNEK